MAKIIFVRDEDLDRMRTERGSWKNIEAYGKVVENMPKPPEYDDRFDLQFNGEKEPGYYRVTDVRHIITPHATYQAVVLVKEVEEEFDS